MATEYLYPPDLPAPTSSSFKPAQRVRRSDLSGPLNQAGRERDFRGTDDVSFSFTPAQAAVFDAWWRTDLLMGAAKFVVEWPVPAGWRAVTTRNFTTAPRWERQAGGNWRVSASTDVHGQNLLKYAAEIGSFVSLHTYVNETLPSDFPA